MKSKALLVLIISILCLGFFSGLLSGISVAENGHYELSIVEKNYKIYKTDELAGDTWVYFNISITLHNSGAIESDNITVTIEDEDGIILRRNGTILPGKNKTFRFEDHPLKGMKEHQINISYYPTLANVPVTNYNYGDDVLILLPQGGDDSTPGFEIIFIIMALVVYALSKRCKKQL